MKINKAKKVLVIQPMVGIGDMLWFLPHVRAIADHFSKGQVFLMAQPSSKASTLLQHEPCVQEIIPLYKKQLNNQGKIRNPDQQQNYRHDELAGFFHLVADIKKHNFDAVWVLDRRPQYAYAAKLAGVREVHGFGCKLDKYMITPPGLPKEFQKGHARDRATHFMHQYNIDISKYETPLKVGPDVQQKINDTFKKQGKWVCLGIGASEVEKKWPAQHFSALADLLCQQGFTCFICGGPSESAEAQQIKADVPEQHHGQIHCITDFSVMETAALVSVADIYAGNDTFLYNLAGMQGVTSFGIGGADPIRNYLKTMNVIRSKQGISSVSAQDVAGQILQHS